MITEKPFSRNPIKIILFSSSRTKDNFSFSILVVLFLILRICLNKVIACGNPKTSRIYVLTIANLAFVESLFCYPLWIGTLWYQTSGVLCFISCHFSLLILRICLNKVIACGNPKTSRIYVLTIANLAFVESLFCYPLWIGTLWYQTSGVLCFISCHFSLQEYTREGLTPEMLYCIVLFFFPPSLPPWVILRYVIGLQRGLLGI